MIKIKPEFMTELPEGCKGCPINALDFCMILEEEVPSIISKTNKRHPQCPLSDTTITSEEVRQDLDILQTNAVEGLEETQNTIDSQNCINNITQYISELESKLTPQLDSDVKEAINAIVTFDMGKELGSEILRGEYDSQLYKDYLTITQYINELESERDNYEEYKNHYLVLRPQAGDYVKQINKLQSTLDKVKEELVHRYKISDTIILDIIQELLKEVK